MKRFPPGDRGLAVVAAGVSWSVGSDGSGFPTVGRTRRESGSSGYAEWRNAGELVVDGQRVRADAADEMEGQVHRRSTRSRSATKCASTATRQPDGIVLASEIDVRPNGTALFEATWRQGTDAARRPLGAQR